MRRFFYGGPPAARFWEKRDQNFYTFAPLAPLLTRVLSLDVLLDRELTASNRIVGRARFARCNVPNPRARHKVGLVLVETASFARCNDANPRHRHKGSWFLFK